MAIKNIYEVFDEFNKAKSKTDRIDTLRRNDTWALRQVLLGAFHPTVKFTVKKVPEYRKVEMPAGMSYGHMTEALSRVYLFQEGNPRVPAGLTEKRKEELLMQLLESLEIQEAEVFGGMLLKNLKVKYLTEALVNEAFPGLLPQS
jgi:hypothetical protein